MTFYGIQFQRAVVKREKDAALFVLANEVHSSALFGNIVQHRQFPLVKFAICIPHLHRFWYRVLFLRLLLLMTVCSHEAKESWFVHLRKVSKLMYCLLA